MVFVIGALLLNAGVPAADEPPPFLRLRETALGYHGPSDDFTNLTEIRIGWFGPTDFDDPLTGDLWWAANLAIEEANTHASHSGLPAADFRRLPFRLVPRWSIDPWGTGVSQLTRMVYDEQPLALLGSVDSASTHLAEQIVAKANLPLVSPIATDKSVTLAGVSWMFSCAPSDGAVARVLVDDVLAALPDGTEPEIANRKSKIENRKSSIVLLAFTDHESRMTAREVVREFSRRGRMPDARFDLAPGVAASEHVLDALAEAAPAAVIVIAGAEDSARLVRAVREELGAVPIFGSHSMGRRRFLELAGSAAEGVRFPRLFAPDPANERASGFVSRFTAGRQHPPDYTAALTYDATRLLVEAIHRAGPNRARVRAALLELSPWAGAAGTIRFDGTGQNPRDDLTMGTIRNGAVTAIPVSTPPTLTALRNQP